MTLAPNSCSTSVMRRLAAITYTLVIALLMPAHAAVTHWTEVQGGAVRLIASGEMTDGYYLAGIEFALDPGWHTYWRYPGEAGIPPQITLDGSQNVRSLEVLYPVPEHYSDGFSESIVYQGGIVLPLKIAPVDTASPAVLALDVFFGVCNDICVPGEASLSVDLDPQGKTDSLANMLISRDLAAVPGPSTSPNLAVSSVQLAPDGKSLEITTSVSGTEKPDLFAAGPEGSYIGLPKLTSQSDGSAMFLLSTKGLKTSQNDNILRLVLKSGPDAIEHLEPVPPEWAN